mmetsp:Transcript_55494/g.63400  ORF Transcript_55494/g.63400 Transcript_55494/m.63400 type:complete len:461 (-) Transcript_55494:170-1552(-)
MRGGGVLSTMSWNRVEKFFEELPYLELILLFNLAVYLFEFYLSKRQFTNFGIKKVPRNIRSIVPIQKFEKAQAYQKDKFQFSFLKDYVDLTENSVFLYFAFFPYFWAQAGKVTNHFQLEDSNKNFQALVFLLITSLIGEITNIGYSLYSTFVIEERHGFNKQTLKIFFTDIAKKFLITIIIGYPILYGVLYIIIIGGDYFYVYVWGFVAVMTLIMMEIYPNFIAPLLNTFTELEPGELKTKIEKLAASLDYPLKKIYVMDGSRRSHHSNAYLYGFGPNKRIVLYDTLIEQVEADELVGVLAHELGHWKYSHTLKHLIISNVQVFVIFFLYGQMKNYQPLYTSFGFDEPSTFIGLFIFSQIYSPVSYVLGLVLTRLVRRFEFQADAFAKSLGYKEELGNALVKLYQENSGIMVPDSWYASYHFSHPHLTERLAAVKYENTLKMKFQKKLSKKMQSNKDKED